MHTTDPRKHFDTGVKRLKHFACDHAGGNASDRFTSGSTSPALPVADAVFGLVSEIGVRRTEGRLHFAVGLRPRIFVADKDGDGSAEGFALEHAGKNFAAVGLFARSDDIALPRTAAVEFLLDVSFGQIDLRQTAVDDNTDPAAVGFSPRGDAEKLAGDAGHVRLL